MEPMLTALTMRVLPVLPEPMLTSMRAKHVQITDTALSVPSVVHILQVLVLLEPMLSAIAMRVLPVLATDTALPVQPFVHILKVLVLLEPMLTVVAMHASHVLATHTALPVCVLPVLLTHLPLQTVVEHVPSKKTTG